jgi:hypothetical protein
MSRWVWTAVARSRRILPECGEDENRWNEVRQCSASAGTCNGGHRVPGERFHSAHTKHDHVVPIQCNEHRFDGCRNNEMTGGAATTAWRRKPSVSPSRTTVRSRLLLARASATHMMTAVGGHRLTGQFRGYLATSCTQRRVQLSTGRPVGVTFTHRGGVLRRRAALRALSTAGRRGSKAPDPSR